MTIVEFAKISHSQAVTNAAAKFSAVLTSRGLARYPWSWGAPCIAAMREGVCIGFVAFSEDMDDLSVSLDMAFVEPGHPRLLARLLRAFRVKYRDSRFQTVRFTCHPDNPDMAKAAKAFGCRIRSINFEGSWGRE